MSLKTPKLHGKGIKIISRKLLSLSDYAQNFSDIVA